MAVSVQLLDVKVQADGRVIAKTDLLGTQEWPSLDVFNQYLSDVENPEFATKMLLAWAKNVSQDFKSTGGVLGKRLDLDASVNNIVRVNADR